MRCLSKVVFINSANVPYAEIRLDGNVHFIGTQGVGKSTLLRAILFFYNGDKLKLGIPKEKKGFDDFYLPHSNSYIVYEVSHERGDFCVLTFRSQGRACFRFIAGKYDRRLLVDDTGDVTGDYTVIRQRLSGRYMSRIIDKYDEYRNIIYGNHRATDKEFYNFALMESPSYQNIPRSLQNVFLNSRVDAEFIKEIIIRSMNDEVPAIDLSYYRRQVADFAMEYSNISEWFREDSKGVVAVRVNAQKVIDNYRRLLYLRNQSEILYAELLFADRVARESLPRQKEKEQNHLSELLRLERLLSEQQQKFDKEKEDVNKAIGEVESKLKSIKAKRKYYEEIGIDALLARVAAYPAVKMQLESLAKRKEMLTVKSRSLSAKYEALQECVRTEFLQFENIANTKIVEAKESFLADSEKLSAELGARTEEIDREYASALGLLGEKTESLSLKERELDRETVQLSYLRPLGKEIEAKSARLTQLEQSAQALKSQVRAYELEIENLQQTYEMEREKLFRDFENQQKDLEREIAGIEENIRRIDELLSSASGSFYEWLDSNVPGWERNVGKVIDQQRILYRKGLKPKFVDDGKVQSLYGIEIDMGEVESTVKTPAMLRQEKEMYENAVLDIRAVITEKASARDKALEALSDRYSPKMKELLAKKNTDAMSLQILPGQIKALETEIKGLEDRQAEMLAARKEELEKRRQSLAGERIELERGKKSIDDSKAGKLKDARKLREQKLKALEKARDSFLADRRAEIADKRNWQEQSMQELISRRDAELKGAGVDVAALKDCENQIRSVNDELAFIDANRDKTVEYGIDKRDLFDREDEFRQTRRALEDKRSALSEKHQIRVRQLNDKRKVEKASLETVQKSIRESEEGFVKLEEFRASELFPTYLHGLEERPSSSMALPLIEELRNTIMERMQVKDLFKRSVNIFKAPFGQGNVFRFKTNLVLDEDYMEYAANLEEFVEQNKIEEYRGRTSDRYLEILQRVSREMGDIGGYASQVEKIIREINADFREKNFVGAIRSIEIRRTDSADNMVQLLLKIKEFTDENAFSLGGLNLFSEEKGRDAANREAVRYLEDFMSSLNDFSSRSYLTLSDTFMLQFRVVENDNDTGWVEKIANVGSDGTDILVKAMVNIMLINVFKEKVSRRFGEFRLHCMMDEIGKLHPNNVKGILDFANSRNILLINSSPTTYNVSDYRYTYLLSKDQNAKTIINPLISRREASVTGVEAIV